MSASGDCSINCGVVERLKSEVARLRRGEFTTQEIADLPFSIYVRNQANKALREPRPLGGLGVHPQQGESE